MINDYYYYHRLSPEGQEAYKRTHSAILNRDNSVSVADLNILPDDYMDIFRAIVFDNPMFYYIDYSNIKLLSDGRKVVSAEPRYVYSKEQCNKLDALIEKNAKAIIERANIEGKSVAEQIHAIHNVLAENVVYDFDALANQGKIEDIHFAHTLLGVILRRKAVCDGISKAFKFLLNSIGIRSIIVFGVLKDGEQISFLEHAWNIVKIGDFSYHIDVTNDIKETQSDFVCQDYYCLNDNLIMRDHADFRGVPECTGTEENYFDSNKYVAKNRDNIVQLIETNFKTFPASVYCRIDFDEPLEDIVNWMQDLIMKKMMVMQKRAILYSSMNLHAGTVIFYVK